jgi:hypothetical protein
MLSTHLRLGLPSGLFPSEYYVMAFLIVMISDITVYEAPSSGSVVRTRGLAAAPVADALTQRSDSWYLLMAILPDAACAEFSDSCNGHITSGRKVLLCYKSSPLPVAMLFISFRTRPYPTQSGLASELRSDHQLILSGTWESKRHG